MEKQTSIYRIINSVNGKIYVGRTTTTIELRWKRHCWASKKGNTYMGRAIQKYGPDAFRHELLESVDPANANEREEYWIKFLGSFDSSVGYNLNWVPSGSSDTSECARRKLGAASKKFWNSMAPEERSALLSKRMSGLKHSESHNKNLSNSKAGKSPDVKKTSRYVGVRQRIRGGKISWDTTCYYGGKQYTRCCKTENEAAQCYDRFALALRGTSAVINFPNKRDAYLKEDLQQFLNNVKRPKSSYRFVTYHNGRKKWGVCYKRNFIDTNFETEIEAAKQASLCSGLSLDQLSRSITSRV